jgi:hypothetical protein
MKRFVAGLSYKTAPVELREKVAVTPARLRVCAATVAGQESSAILPRVSCSRPGCQRSWRGDSTQRKARAEALFLEGADMSQEPFDFIIAQFVCERLHLFLATFL